jgi:hypothetical protein
MITFCVGLFAFADYFITQQSVSRIGQLFSQWVPIIASIALILGAISLIKHHYQRIRTRHKDRFYSLAALVSMLVTSFFGLFFGVEDGTPFKVIFDSVYKPMTTAMFALLAFYLASAAFRTFRLRSFEAGLLFAAAFIVMLGRIPAGTMIASWLPGFADEWIMDVFTTSAMRAIRIGAGLGMATLSLKIIFGLERTYIR